MASVGRMLRQLSAIRHETIRLMEQHSWVIIYCSCRSIACAALKVCAMHGGRKK